MLSLGPNGIPDGNPEAIIVGSPLDGTQNVGTALGNVYEDITGVVTFQYALRLWISRLPTNACIGSASTTSYLSQLRK